MTKNDLIVQVSETSNLTRIQATAAVEATFDLITKALKAGRRSEDHRLRLLHGGEPRGARRAQSTYRRAGADCSIKGAKILRRQGPEGGREPLAQRAVD